MYRKFGWLAVIVAVGIMLYTAWYMDKYDNIPYDKIERFPEPSVELM